MRMENFFGGCAKLVGPAMWSVLTLICTPTSPRDGGASTALVANRSNRTCIRKKRGRESCDAAARTIRGEVRPVQSLEARFLSRSAGVDCRRAACSL